MLNKKGDTSPQPTTSGHYCCTCERAFTTPSGFKRHKCARAAAASKANEQKETGKRMELRKSSQLSGQKSSPLPPEISQDSTNNKLNQDSINNNGITQTPDSDSLPNSTPLEIDQASLDQELNPLPIEGNLKLRPLPTSISKNQILTNNKLSIPPETSQVSVKDQLSISVNNHDMDLSSGNCSSISPVVNHTSADQEISEVPIKDPLTISELDHISVGDPLSIPPRVPTPPEINQIPLNENEIREIQLDDPLSIGSSLEDDELRDKMKGVMLNKVNELIDETSALGPGKCHCCGEDLDTAHLGGDFQCVDCSKSFKLKSSLERHRRVIHMEGDTYSCPECEARCPDKGTLARHMYTHTGLKPYSCVRCEKQFSRKYHLERHVVQTGCDGNPKPTHPCQVCGRLFSRKDNLREHLRAHAGQVKRKKKYSCDHCSKEFQGTTLLHIHMRTHTGEKPYQCDFCTKSFPSSGAMKKHRRMHTGERPYECKECFAKFAAKETLNRHVRTHTGMKPHVCQFCGKGFIQASQLRAHIFHHTGENGFTCQHCSKAFNRRSRLLMHVKYVHEGAKPYECTECNKTFVRKEDLARHAILHSGVKAHKCPICQKSFAMKSSLKIHLLTHTKEPPRSCDECGRAFIRQDCLLRHMRTKHRDMLEEILAEAEKKKLQQQLLAAASDVSNLTTPHAAIEPGTLSESALADSVRELLTLLVDEATLKVFGWPDASVDQLLEAVIRRCGHQPVLIESLSYTDRLRENAKLLFTVVIDDSAVKTLLNNQTVDEVILHVLRLAKS